MMKVQYARTQLERSIFLAGPTPRSADVESWRPKALEILQEIGFDGTVYVPEDATWGVRGNYDDQVLWELDAMDRADVVVFWIPRDLETMPAFTTNVEFGMMIKSGKAMYGRPDGTPKTTYLDALATLNNMFVYEDLYELLIDAVEQANLNDFELVEDDFE